MGAYRMGIYFEAAFPVGDYSIKVTLSKKPSTYVLYGAV